jgi:hypothetical protein
LEHVTEVPDVITETGALPGDRRWDHAREHHDIRAWLLVGSEGGGSGRGRHWSLPVARAVVVCRACVISLSLN